MISEVNLDAIVDLARKAGRAIMDYYASDLKVEVALKEDLSPITKADQASHDIIICGLNRLYPNIPILSEEGTLPDYSIRKNWNYFWLIDPLDGTKEFINKTDEFTVNIALIYQNQPVLGVVFAPALGLMYFAKIGFGAFKEVINGSTFNRSRLTQVAPISGDKLVVVGSRSHMNLETQHYVDNLKLLFSHVDFKSVGSSLKICYVAEQRADIYPRFGPTMEWDTAAAHAICREVGVKFYALPNKQQQKFFYNKESLLNSWFVVERPRNA
jgi:3'(2'), 5'-bisphosphate nucleotidase